MKNIIVYLIGTVFLLVQYPFFSGKLAFFLLLFVLLVYFVSVKRTKLILLLPGIVGVFGSVLYFLDYEWMKVLFTSSINKRVIIFQTALRASIDNIPFGIGNVNIKNALKPYFVESGNIDLSGLGTHNTFLSFFLRFGIVGILYILAYYLFLTKCTFKKTHRLFKYVVIIVIVSSFTE
ncbi:unnamed protein product, partial [Ectocarpus sp. 12 AP-2014]